jgi:hypothetical protein
MRRAGEPDQRGDAGAFPPLRVFLALMAVLVAIGGLVLLTREDDPPSPTPRTSASPNFALTDAEAIARFKELHALSLRAGRTRDASLLDQVFSSTGPTYARAVRAIHRLRRDKVRDKTSVHFLNIEVARNSHEDIRIIEVSVVAPCFVTEAGRDVTKSPKLARQRTRWTLRQEDSVWLIFDSVLERSRALERTRKRCA